MREGQKTQQHQRTKGAKERERWKTGNTTRVHKQRPSEHEVRRGLPTGCCCCDCSRPVSIQWKRNCPVAPEEGHRRPRSFSYLSFARLGRVDTKHPPTPSFTTTPTLLCGTNHLRDMSAPEGFSDESTAHVYLNTKIDPFCLDSFKDILALN